MDTLYFYCTFVGETARINPEVVFDEEDSGKGIIDDAVMDEKKKTVCRIHAPLVREHYPLQ